MEFFHFTRDFLRAGLLDFYYTKNNTYVNNNPIMYYDYTGHMAEDGSDNKYLNYNNGAVYNKLEGLTTKYNNAKTATEKRQIAQEADTLRGVADVQVELYLQNYAGVDKKRITVDGVMGKNTAGALNYYTKVKGITEYNMGRRDISGDMYNYVVSHGAYKGYGDSVTSQATQAYAESRMQPSTGNSERNISSWNQWNIQNIATPGNLFGTSADIFENSGEVAKEYVPNAIRGTIRPNNIGVGIWNTYIEDEAATATSKFSTVAKVGKCAGYAAIGVDVGLGIYENIENGAPTKKTVSDGFVDTAFGGGGLATSVATGAGLGSLGCPVIGTAIGGVAAGIVYVVGTEVWKPGGKSIKDRAKEGIYNSIK